VSNKNKSHQHPTSYKLLPSVGGPEARCGQPISRAWHNLYLLGRLEYNIRIRLFFIFFFPHRYSLFLRSNVHNIIMASLPATRRQYNILLFISYIVCVRVVRLFLHNILYMRLVHVQRRRYYRFIIIRSCFIQWYYANGLCAFVVLVDGRRGGDTDGAGESARSPGHIASCVPARRIL